MKTIASIMTLISISILVPIGAATASESPCPSGFTETGSSATLICKENAGALYASVAIGSCEKQLSNDSKSTWLYVVPNSTISAVTYGTIPKTDAEDDRQLGEVFAYQSFIVQNLTTGESPSISIMHSDAAKQAVLALTIAKGPKCYTGSLTVSGMKRSDNQMLLSARYNAPVSCIFAQDSVSEKNFEQCK